jgi:23S rRNA pseudouridine1911/1915/1917 synthase
VAGKLRPGSAKAVRDAETPETASPSTKLWSTLQGGIESPGPPETEVTEEQEERIDKFLTRSFPDRSRNYFQGLFEQDLVLVKKRGAAAYLPVAKRQKVRRGDRVAVELLEPPPLAVLPEDLPLEVIYEDEDVVILNKVAGMVVHPAMGTPSGTVANALVHRYGSIDGDELRPGIVHRLDKDTSGALVVAKTSLALRRLAEQFAERSTEKTYLAICWGKPREGTFSAPIGRHRQKRKQMSVREDGKKAVSEFRVLATALAGPAQGLSVVEVRLHTGRTHQIRVHLKALNCPLIGDSVYGNLAMNRRYKADRQMLHARALKIQHPVSEAPLQAVAPIPEDMQGLIRIIKAHQDERPAKTSDSAFDQWLQQNALPE